MDTKTELIKSAENVARRRGYDGFSFADLAKDVGIRKASIHHHFPTKADLSLAVIQHYASKFFDALSGIDENSDIASDRLAAYVQFYRSALGGGTKLCLCVAFCLSRDSLSSEALEELEAFHLRSINWLQATFELAEKDKSVAGLATPKEEARSLIALVEGAQLIARCTTNVSDFDESTSLFLSRLS